MTNMLQADEPSITRPVRLHPLSCVSSRRI